MPDCSRLLSLLSDYLDNRLPADVRETACHCVLDWIGVALAASSALPAAFR